MSRSSTGRDHEASGASSPGIFSVALSDPTRTAIYEYLATADEPATVSELTEFAGVHHNAVRQHLRLLEDAGLVHVSTLPPAGRGRPRRAYRADRVAAGRWNGDDPYEELSMLLAEVVSTGESPESVGHRAGLERAELARARRPGAASNAGIGSIAGLLAELERRGFAPRRDGEQMVLLERCPFSSAVQVDAATVCALHLGLARGVAEAAGLRVDDLVPGDPEVGGCRLYVAE